MIKVPTLVKTKTTSSNEMLDVVIRSQEGDQEAFYQLFRRYNKPILSFIYNIVGEQPLAEEITQETFVRAYRSLKNLKDSSKFSTWLFGIAKNIIRETLKEKDYQQHVKLEEIDLENEDTPDKQMINSELNEVIKQAVLSLNEDWRIVFTLKMFQQKSYEEIAEITGWSIGKIKTDLHRARLEVRKKLQDYLAY